jgi:hypothetical protein
MRILARAGAVMAALTAAAGMALAAPFPYRVQHRIPLTGTAPVRALAAGPEARHVYAAVRDEVRGFDPAGRAGSRVKLPGVVTGLAAGAGDTLYAVVGAPARLVILSVRPLHVVVSVPLHAGAPSAVLFDPLADELFAESRAGRSVTRLDPGTGRQLGVVRLHGELMQMASDGRGTLYLASAGRDALEVIDASKMTFSGEIPLARSRAPSGLAMDTLGRRLFVGCGNGRELIVDSDLGYTFRRLPIQRSTSLQAVFAFHPLGHAGWKGGTLVAGGSEVDAIRMYAFVRYDGGGRLALTRPETALALNPAAGELWLALAPRAAAADDPSGPELLVLGPSCTEVSR